MKFHRTRPTHRRHDPQWAPGPRARQEEFVLATDILKELYPQHRISGGPVWARPQWAKLAYARGWMSAEDYYAVEEEPTGEVLPRKAGVAYERSPFFAMIPRRPLQTEPEARVK